MVDPEPEKGTTLYYLERETMTDWTVTVKPCKYIRQLEPRINRGAMIETKNLEGITNTCGVLWDQLFRTEIEAWSDYETTVNMRLEQARERAERAQRELRELRAEYLRVRGRLHSLNNLPTGNE